MRLRRLIEVGQVFARELHVGVEVVGAAVRDRLEFAPAPRKEILDVGPGLRVVRTLLRRQLVEAQPVGANAVVAVPFLARRDPLLVDRHVVAVVGNEILQLGLFELAHAEGEVAGRDLVAKRLADLRDAERRPLARALVDVLEIDEDALSGFRPQIRRRRGVLHRTDRASASSRLKLRGSVSVPVIPQSGHFSSDGR